MLASLLTFLLVGLVGLVVIGVALAAIGVVFSVTLGLAAFLLFKVAPIVLLGYVIVRLMKPKRRQISAEDQKWLEG